MTWRVFCIALVLGAGLALDRPVAAGSFPYILDIDEAFGVSGGIADVSFSTDNSGLGYTGWGWGVCQGGEGFATIDSVSDGADVGALNDGDGPEFNAVTLLPNGWTIGAIVELVGNGQLLPGVGLEMNIGHYLTSSVGTETLFYCSTLGSPPVIITLTLDGGGVADETTGDLQLNGGSVTGEIVPLFESTLNDATGLYDCVSGSGANVSTTHALSETADAGGLATQGFSLGFAQSGPCDLVAADPTGVLAAINDGDGPEFFGSNIAPIGGPGFTVGVVYALLGGSDIVYTTTPQDVILFEYDPQDAALAGDPGPYFCDLTHSDVVGDPPVVNTIVAGPTTVSPLFNDGTIEIFCIFHPSWVRGDCNDDGIVNIADGINIIDVYVIGGPPVGDCVSACDTNGDEIGPDVSDAVYVFNYRFLGGPPPPAPFPGCGQTSGDNCNGYDSCP